MRDFRDELLGNYLLSSRSNSRTLYNYLEEYNPIVISGYMILPDTILKYSEETSKTYKISNLVEYLNGNNNNLSRIVLAPRESNVFAFSDGTVITFQTEKELIVACNIQLYEIEHLFNIVKKAFTSETSVSVQVISAVDTDIQPISELVYSYSVENEFIYKDEILYKCGFTKKQQQDYIQGYTSCLICDNLEYDLLAENKGCSIVLKFSDTIDKVEFELSYADLIIWGDKIFKNTKQRMGNVTVELFKKFPAWKTEYAREVIDIINQLSEEYSFKIKE